MEGAEFDHLSEPELRLQQAFPRGELVDMRAATGEGLRNAECWGPARQVRAEVIASLIIGSSPPQPGMVPAVRLAGARVIGELRLANVEIQCLLDFEHCIFDSDILLEEARAHSIRLRGCQVPHLNANRSDLRGELQAQGCRFGSLSLYAARVFEVEISGSRFADRDQVGLYCDLLTVDAAMYCHDIEVEGMIRLPGAHIAGYLELDGAHLNNPAGLTIQGTGLTVDHGLFCRPGDRATPTPFTSNGEICLDGAQIKGSFLLDHADLTNPGTVTLTADQARVDGISCREMISRGQIRLRAFRADGPLAFSGAQLINPNDTALDAENAVIDGNMSCDQGFTSHGHLRLSGIRINGRLNLDSEPRNDSPPSGPGAFTGSIDLEHAHVGTLHDTPSTWPSRLHLDGLRYTRLAPHLNAKRRLEWLARDTAPYRPQPYEELVSHYRAIGHDHDARTVLLAKERHRRETLHLPARLWGLAQDVIVGYGYRPWLAGVWLLGLLVIGTTYFTAHPPQALKAGETPHFSPLAYTLDLLLPIISLGQEKAWKPAGTAQALAYILIVSGWVLATAVVAGITRGINRA